MNSSTCKNCSTEVTGKFCHECGQPISTDKIDLHYFVNEIISSILQVEKGFFYTALTLTKRPGHSIREYLEGKRVLHFKPLAYMVVTSAIYVFLAYLFDFATFTEDLFQGFEEGATEEDNPSTSGISSALDWLANNHVYALLMTLPVFSLASNIVFKGAGLHYLEHLVLNIYITGHQTLIYTVCSLFPIADTVFEVVPLFLAMGFNIWAFYQCFNYDSKLGRLLKSVAVYLLFLLFIIALIVVGGMVAVSIWGT